MRPIGHHYQQASAAEDIRVAVERYILTTPCGIFHEIDQSLPASGAWSALVEMRDVNGNTAAHADLKRLAEGVKVSVAETVAHMSMVEPAQICNEFAQRDKLIRICVASGRIVQPCG